MLLPNDISARIPSRSAHISGYAASFKTCVQVNALSREANLKRAARPVG